MMKRPDWIMDKIRAVESKPKPRDQITVVAMNPAGRSGQMMPISTSGPTGAGSDNTVQPFKRTGDVHEGEFVVDAEAAQALDPELLSTIVQKAKEGTLDLNALRAAAGVPGKEGYAIGGLVRQQVINSGVLNKPPASATTTNSGISQLPGTVQASMSQETKDAAASAPTPAAPTPAAVGYGISQLPGTVQADMDRSADPSNRSGFNSTAPAGSFVNNMTNMQPISGPPKIDPIVQTAAPKQTVQIGATSFADKNGRTWNSQQEADDSNALIDQNAFRRSQVSSGPVNTTEGSAPPVQEPAPAGDTGGTGTTTAATTPPPGTSRYTNVINSSLRRVLDTAEGKSEAEQRIANQGLRNYDTRAASEKDANRMDLALMGDNVPDSAKNAMMAQNASSIRSGRSQLIGDMSAGAAERASAANVTAANIASGQQTFEAGQKQLDRENAFADIDRLVAAGAAENMPAIQAKYKALGIDINPEYILNAEKAKRFTDAKAFLATAMAEPGATTASVIAAANAAGFGDVLSDAFGGTAAQWTGDPAQNPVAILQATGPAGLNDEQVNWLIDNGYDLTTGQRSDNGGLTSYISAGMKASNPIDKAWATYSNSAWFKGLDANTQKTMKALFDYAQSGKGLPYSVTVNADGSTTIVPKSEEEVSGAYTGDPFSADAVKILSNPQDANYKSVIDAAVAKIKTTGDVTALNKMTNTVAKKAITDALAAEAVSWAGAVNAKRVDDMGGKDTSFVNPPKKGSIITYNGKTYLVDSEVIAEGGKSTKKTFNHQSILLRDLSTGETFKLLSADKSLTKV